MSERAGPPRAFTQSCLAIDSLGGLLFVEELHGYPPDRVLGITDVFGGIIARVWPRGRRTTRDLHFGPRTYVARFQSFTFRSRRALVITLTLLKLMAAAAKMGLSRMPKKGYKTPAAMGTPRAL